MTTAPRARPDQQQPALQTAPVWPTSMKVFAALLAGASFTALVLVKVLPADQATNAAATGSNGFAVAGTPAATGPGETAPAGAVPAGGQPGRKAAGQASPGGSKAGRSGGGASVGGGGGGTGSDNASGAKAGLDCAAGKNGGSTDTGVSDSTIKLAANVVTDGPGSNFLGSSPTGMEAVVRRVNNQEGGICGRKLDLKTVNDSWDANRGRTNIQDFVNQGYFALPVMPSSEGLSAAIDAGLIESSGIPVPGTDGMRKEQYAASGKASWVWPVATATVSQVRIMAKYAYERLGARTFGIVYDKKYKFGVEGADAFENYLKSLSGATLKIRLPIEPGQNSYASDANAFKDKCNNTNCDVVVLLLEPQTGISWMASAGESGKGIKMTAAAQPLFNDKFARGCGEVCNGVFVWTGYNPALGSNTSNPDVARFINDVKAVDPSVDVSNQFLEGAYLGMEVFVKALKDCSPNLTRACVKQRMDSTDYSSGLTSTLSWRAGQHFANQGARAYSIGYTQSSFSGFSDEQTGFIPDPTPGVVPG